jgi:hypothetical protein
MIDIDKRKCKLSKLNDLSALKAPGNQEPHGSIVEEKAKHLS